MEEKWLTYLKENAPELYKEALESIEYSVNWRNNEIKRLREVIAGRNQALVDIRNYATACLPEINLMERIIEIVKGEINYGN